MRRMPIKFLLGLALMLLIVAGCREEPEPPSFKSPTVVRRKIEAPQPPPVQALKPSDQEPAEPVTAKEPPEAEAPETPPVEVAKVEPAPPEAEPPTAKPELEAKPPPEEAEKEVAYFYDPEGKIDPFQSIFVMQTREATRAERAIREERLPLTPLQKIDLSQLKLVGIILAASGNKALVEDPSGKGYVITRGTYVGANFGRVQSILKDKVIVEEQVEDFFTGQMKPQTVELRLQKKLGEL